MKKTHRCPQHTVIGSHTENGSWIAYTVGLSPAHGFEVFVSGIRPEIACVILNYVAAGLEAGEVIKYGEPDDRWASMPCKFVQVSNAEYVFKAVQAYGSEVRIIQMIVPDKKGRFPGDKGFDQTLLFAQHLLTPVLTQ